MAKLKKIYLIFKRFSFDFLRVLFENLCEFLQIIDFIANIHEIHREILIRINRKHEIFFVIF